MNEDGSKINLILDPSWGTADNRNQLKAGSWIKSMFAKQTTETWNKTVCLIV